MASITLSTNFTDLYFSSQIPDIVFSTDAGYIVVSLYADGNCLMSESYYPYGGRSTVRNLYQIVEQYCEEHSSSFCQCTLSAETDEGDELQRSFSVIYCKSNPSQSAVMWASSHFLTTRQAKLMPRHELAVDYLWVYADDACTEPLRYHVTIEKNKEVKTLTVASAPFTAQKRCISMLSVRYGYILQMVHNAEGSSVKILSVTIEVGERSMSYFITDRMPSAMFLFANAFGCRELATLDCETTDKIHSNRSVAVIGRRSEFYDREQTKEYEVQTSPLDDDTARWLEQLMVSYDVRFVEDYGVLEDDDLNDPPRILITDFTSEISDGDSGPNKVKFTWQYSDIRPYLKLRKNTDGVFSRQYSNTFK